MRTRSYSRERPEIAGLQGLLDELEEMGADSGRVSIADLQQTLGSRAFGPMLLVAALPSLTPIATIPALPSILSLIIIFTAGQMLLGRKDFWLPQTVLDRSISQASLLTAIRFIRPVARFIDRISRPRLATLTKDPFARILAACSCALALFTVPLEFVPFTGGIPAFPIALFGLALMGQDGALVIAGLVAMLLAFALLALIATFGIAILEEAWRIVVG